MEFHNKEAIYLQIADIVCENVLLGKWKENDRIPSTRDLAVAFEVNPNTVVRTYMYLQERNIIANHRGVGYFVAQGGYQQTVALKKREFVEQELPRIFKMADLLKLSITDVVGEYEKGNWRNNQPHQDSHPAQDGAKSPFSTVRTDS